MVNIQSPTAEIRRGKERRKKERKKETKKKETGRKYNGLPYYIGDHNYLVFISICCTDDDAI